MILLSRSLLGNAIANFIFPHTAKDLSRLGRDYLKTGELIEIIFPEFDVRYIAVNIIDDEEREKLEQMRREFTSNVSHELKTPLTSISGFAEMLMQGNADRETVSDFSKSIYDESQRMITLVQDILRISELDEKNEFEQEQVDLYDLAEEVTARL